MVIGLGGVLLLILLFFLRVKMVKRRRARIKAAKRERRIREIARQQLEMDEDRRRRDWTYGGSYEQLAPRTSDLRKEAIEAELAKSDKSKRKDAKAEKKRAAAKEKALKEKEKAAEKTEEQTKE